MTASTKPAKSLLAVGLCAVICTPAYGRYEQTATVNYFTSAGKSDEYRVPVTFLTGTELNRLTNSVNYDALNGRYAVIFWDKSPDGNQEASVIELETFVPCVGDFSQSCLSILGQDDGTDQAGRKWHICTGILCY